MIDSTVRLAASALIAACFVGCAGNGRYVEVGPPPEKKLIVLSKPGKYSKLAPYEVNGETYYPLADSEGFVQVGKASWYGKKFHARPTASGEIFNMYEKTAAHKTLPLGTYVKVTNLSNGKETVLRINDRGPFVKGRIVDLSYAAAKDLGMIGPGVADVKVVALGKEVGRLNSPSGIKPVVEVGNLHNGEFTVQVGAFRDRFRALKVADRLKVIFDYVDVCVWEGSEREVYYRVRVSKSKTLERAGEFEKRLEEMGFSEAFIVSL